MTSTRRSLRVETPVLEPDDALVGRLAASARRSVAPARRRRFGDWRVSLITAGLVVLTTGGAYAAGVIGPLHLPKPAHEKPPSEETEPVPASPTDRGRDSVTDQPVGRPTDLPTEGTGGPTGRPTGPPTGEPSDLPTDQPTELPTAQPTGQPTGHPTPQPTGKPTAQPTPGHPTGNPTSPPTGPPSGAPSATPTRTPTDQPTRPPTGPPATGKPSPQGGP